MSTLKDKTAKGLLWGAMNNGLMQLLNAVFGIVLGRILSLSDYGLVGMLTIFTTVAVALQESGFTSALANKSRVEHRDYNSVFWFTMLMGAALYTLLFLASPLIARYFHQPQLNLLSKVAFLCIPLSAIGIVPQAYMFRRLMVKENTIIRISALLTSGGVGIVMALSGKAYWSLVCQQLLYVAITSFGKFFCIPWRPTWYIDFTPVRSIFGFSFKIMLTSVINTVSNNLLTLIFGRLFTSAVVGSFSQAYKWNNMAHSLVSGTVAQVAQPVFAQVVNDEARLANIFRKMTRFTAFLAFPVMFGLCIISHEFIVLTIGAKWLPSVQLLQILCICGAFLPLQATYQNLIVSRGRSDLYLWGNVGLIACTLLLVVFGSSRGIVFMVSLYAALNIVWLVYWQYHLRRLLPVSRLDMLKDMLPFMVIAAVIMGAVYVAAAPIASLWLRLIVKIVLAALLYFAAMKLLHAEILNECIGYLRKRK